MWCLIESDNSWSCHCSDNAVDIIPWPCVTMTPWQLSVTGGVITGHWYHRVISDTSHTVTTLSRFSWSRGIDSFSPPAKHRSESVIKDTQVFTLFVKSFRFVFDFKSRHNVPPIVMVLLFQSRPQGQSVFIMLLKCISQHQHLTWLSWKIFKAVPPWLKVTYSVHCSKAKPL